MASSKKNISNQKKHEILADFIKKVHSTLRKNVRKAHGDFQSVWREHCEDKTLLKQYAEAMKELAVQHWDGNNLKRIEWCRQICSEYFMEGGYQKCLRKDCRRVLLNLDQHQNCRCAQEAEKLESTLARQEVKKDKLILLDVGSCFNPFQAYPAIFIPLAIDLCPADKTVFICDFLHLNICKQNDLGEKSCTRQCLPDSPTLVTNTYLFPDVLQSCICENEVKQLPENFFNIVVFCLLLSYLPAREQRWECCMKAHKLLRDGGLLIIITPDSSHQNKNAKMMKSWKKAIESIGFTRWKYHKDSHTHCMAFRKKSLCTNVSQEEMEVQFSEMLYIHQDFQDNIEEDKVDSTRTDADEGILSESFYALPFSSV